MLVKFGVCDLEEEAPAGNSFVASKSPPLTQGHDHFSEVTKFIYRGDEGFL